MGYSKILVPLDGSDLAEVALRHLPKIANPGAKVHLLSVLVDEMVPIYPELWEPDGLKRRHDRELYLRNIERPLRQQGFDASIEVRSGIALENIAEVADEGFDIVLIATHRRSALGRFIVGSVSEGLLHKRCCPVLIV